MKGLISFISAAAFTLAIAACGTSDTGITTNVKTKFAQDGLVKATEINVTTEDRVVTLTGDVDTITVREQAVRLARDTEGVRDVVDNLRVRAAATTGDLERGIDNLGDAIKDGAEATGDAVKETGEAIRDAVTDKDRDSDKDGK